MSIQVAIVEDDSDIRQMLSDFISASNNFFLVKTFHDAESFIHEFIDLNVDVVIMDIGLPGQNGIQTVAQLKPRKPNVQFMMCTVFDDDERLFDSLCVGASGYLLKNTSKEELQEAVLQVYNGGSPMSPAIARRVVQSFQSRNTENNPAGKLTPRQWNYSPFLTKDTDTKKLPIN
jgi:DNA-binding NarL/FixJ family response regulator